VETEQHHSQDKDERGNGENGLHNLGPTRAG
jgi:hypothetical protein